MTIKKKVVAILGSTGMVGRRFAELLIEHPWFEVGMLVGHKSINESYQEVWERKESAMEAHYGKGFWQKKPFPESLRGYRVQSFEDLLNADSIDLVFSAVAAEVGHLEQVLLDKGFTVFSNSPYGRFEEKNPLVIPEVNGHEIESQKFIKNPNCVTSGLVMILDVLRNRYGLTEVSAVTFQSLSGRGDAKYRPDLVVGNIYPLHDSEERTEEYIAREVKKILRDNFRFSVSCNRVFVQEGHLVDVKVKTKRRIWSDTEVLELFRSYNPLNEMNLPSSPASPLVVIDETGRPRPNQDAFHHAGLSVAIGNVSTVDDVFDLRLQYVVNNLIRGAAGSAILNAELYLQKQNEVNELESYEAISQR